MIKIVTCKEYVQKMKESLKKEVDSFNKFDKPRLCVIQIGDDAASNTYVKGKRKDAEELGIEFDHFHFKDYTNILEDEFESVIAKMNIGNVVSGIIVQLPIPRQYDIKKLQKCISPEKDVDGFRKDSLFVPCTPKGIMDYLDYNNINLSGKVCTVIGRSEIVGKPLVNLLIERGATVINCNSKTTDIKKFTKESDVVISAIGKANYFDKSYFANGQILVDVGINRDENGKLCGDIREDAKENMLLATPVPCGVGLLTRLALMENTINAYKMRTNR